VPRVKALLFAVPEDVLPDLEIVSNEFAGGNRSEFLRVAVRHFRSRMMAERLKSIRAQGKADRGGRIYSNAEVMALVRAAKGKPPVEE